MPVEGNWQRQAASEKSDMRIAADRKSFADRLSNRCGDCNNPLMALFMAAIADLPSRVSAQRHPSFIEVVSHLSD
ncbi:hypothetical protein [Sinorhizobium fredii]|nr:hypothetical protein [Sinorhizobium fredii]